MSDDKTIEVFYAQRAGTLDMKGLDYPTYAEALADGKRQYLAFTVVKEFRKDV